MTHVRIMAVAALSGLALSCSPSSSPVDTRPTPSGPSQSSQATSFDPANDDFGESEEEAAETQHAPLPIGATLTLPGHEGAAAAVIANLIANGTNSEQWSRGSAIALKRDTCTKLVSGIDNPACLLYPLANGTGALLSIGSPCDGDACQYSQWVLAKTSTTAIRLPDEVLMEHNRFANVELSPGHDFILRGRGLDYEGTGEVGDAARHGGTAKMLVADRTSAHFSEYFSCRLAPSGRYFACRDVRGAVVRVSPDGAEKGLIGMPDVAPDDVSIGGPMEDYPPPPTFDEGGHIVFTTYIKESSAAHPGTGGRVVTRVKVPE